MLRRSRNQSETTSRDQDVSEPSELIQALQPVVELPTPLKNVHFVDKSVASSYHGVARITPDVDLVAEISEMNVSPLVAGFQNEFYLSESSIHDAIRSRSCFNLIHLKSVVQGGQKYASEILH